MDKRGPRKIYWWLILAIILGAGLYLNRSYSRIYRLISQADLRSPDQQETYFVANYMTAANTITYVALGDSLSAGVGVDAYEDSFPYLLAKYLSGNDNQLILKSLAVPGAKAVDVLNTQVQTAIDRQPQIITLLVGVNDIHNNISLAEFSANYEGILQRLSSETRAQIYVINLPLIGTKSLFRAPYRAWFDERTKKFNKAIEKLAANYQVKYLDLYTPTKDLLGQEGEHYSADLFHPSAIGYKIWTDLLYASITQ